MLWDFFYIRAKGTRQQISLVNTIAEGEFDGKAASITTRCGTRESKAI
jgi:hypothetical protein